MKRDTREHDGRLACERNTERESRVTRRDSTRRTRALRHTISRFYFGLHLYGVSARIDRWRPGEIDKMIYEGLSADLAAELRGPLCVFLTILNAGNSVV